MEARVKKFTQGQGEILSPQTTARHCAAALATAMAITLSSFSVAAQTKTDDEFIEYAAEPCEVGPAGLVAAPYNWTVQEVIDYNVICADLFPGGFTSSDNVASTSGIGSIGATTTSTEVIAAKQTDSIEDRLAELQDEEAPSGGWGLLLSVQTGETERDETDNELGYESDLESFVIGVDYRFNNELVAGIAYGVTRDEVEYDDGVGELDTDSESLIAYVTKLIGDGYINGYIGVAPLEYSNERNFSIEGDGDETSGVISGDYDGDQALIGISGGYDWYQDSSAVGVFLNLDYSETDTDGYTEDGDTNYELEYPDQSFESSTATLGINGSFTVDLGWGALIPNASLAAVHEFELDSRTYAAKLVLMPDNHPTEFILETDDPDRDYAIATLGAVIATNSGTQFFLTYEKLLEHDFFDTWSLSAGVLIEI